PAAFRPRGRSRPARRPPGATVRRAPRSAGRSPRPPGRRRSKGPAARRRPPDCATKSPSSPSARFGASPLTEGEDRPLPSLNGEGQLAAGEQGGEVWVKGGG